MSNKAPFLQRLMICLFPLVLVPNAALAQRTAGLGGPSKQVPPAGIDVSAADRAELERNLASLDSAIKELSTAKDAHLKSLLPDVQIYQRAVSTALKDNEFFAVGDIAHAKELLAEGRSRAEQLAKGEAPWTKVTGLVVRGYVSKIDGSVQPFGLVVPESYTTSGNHKYRLDVWLHGRSENLSEVNFLADHRKNAGLFTPPDTIVLHPYGRYCNAFKFAGEVDILEGIEAVKRQYHIDDDRVAMRGFSMGGAGCWHMAVHFADQWVAAAPGAGFVEAADYLKLSDDDVTALPAWQRKLLHWYDCPDWAANLYHCPIVAYNGADDPQKQAADVMEKAMQEEGIALKRIIGPGTKHQYHPDSKKIVADTVDSIADFGRDRTPSEIHLTTYTLRYNRMGWVQIDGLAEHWAESHVNAAVSAGEDQSEVQVETQGVTDLTLSFPPGWAPFDVTKPIQVTIDGKEIQAPREFSDRSWNCQLFRDEKDEWQLGPREEKGLRKRPGLQGPIDDAFLDSFIMVRPTGKSSHAMVDRWAHAEMDHAITQWRRQFRGDARVKDDTSITADDIASANLILWGDPESNAVIKRIADKLPIKWQGNNIVADREKYSAADHAPVIIYPNPLNPKRYIVLNSGFTFRESALASNARQVARLPDWAIIDLRTLPDADKPGKIEAADFFGEHWELCPPSKPESKKTAAVSTEQRPKFASMPAKFATSPFVPVR
jgi:dienelactone hydrolase